MLRYLSLNGTSSQSEQFLLLGTGDLCGQISKHDFGPNRGYGLYFREMVRKLGQGRCLFLLAILGLTVHET